MMKEKTFSVESFFCKKSSEHWRGVFEEYSICTDRFIRVVADQYDDYTDAPYWNNERSNVGMLAAACWRNGWVALEEYFTEKKKEDGSVGGGRCDLWVSSQSGKKNYAIEAKKGYCSLDDENLIEKLVEILEGENSPEDTLDEDQKKKVSACIDAKNLSEDEGDVRMGIAFMHLYLKKSNISQKETLVKKITKKVERYSKSDKNTRNTKRPDFVYIYLKDNGVVSGNGSIIPVVPAKFGFDAPGDLILEYRIQR